MTGRENSINPDNLPVIEEISLYRIATTVKLYQELKTFQDNFKKEGESDWESLGEKKFAEFYGGYDPKTLEGVCYERYYQNYKIYGDNKPFELLKIPRLRGGTQSDGVELELGSYLEVELKKRHIKIKERSIK